MAALIDGCYVKYKIFVFFYRFIVDKAFYDSYLCALTDPGKKKKKTSDFSSTKEIHECVYLSRQT